MSQRYTDIQFAHITLAINEVAGPIHIAVLEIIYAKIEVETSSMRTRAACLRLIFLSFTLHHLHSFTSPFVHVGNLARANHVRPTHRHLVSDWNSLTTCIEYFDGSQIVDPVVVSNVFWSSLISKLVSLAVGQLIATVVFAIFAAFAAQRIADVGTFISDKIFQQEQVFRKLPNPETTASVQPDLVKLAICILIDVIGSSSELIPIFGEVTDVIWAPIAGFILRSIYSSNILFGLEFAEEILPFTDILPLATICWVVDTYFRDSSLAKLLNLGSYGLVDKVENSESSVIDVSATRVQELSSTTERDLSSNKKR